MFDQRYQVYGHLKQCSFAVIGLKEKVNDIGDMSLNVFIERSLLLV